MRVDAAVLAGADDARTVLACLPTAEERSMFEAFLSSGGSAASLSDAEHFCLNLMQVRLHACCMPATGPSVPKLQAMTHFIIC